MSRDREIELKLELEPGASAALTGHPLLKGSSAKTASQISTYFDTPDGALRASGFSLRVREAKGKFVQTVKQSGTASAGLFDRAEWEEQIGSADLDFQAVEKAPLGKILTKKLRKRLEPLIKVEVRRSTWDIEQGGSRIELILDEGEVSGGSESETISEVEIELKSGDASDLIELARTLAKGAPLRLGVLTKAERGYRLADGLAGRIVKAEPLVLRPDMSAAEGFAAIAYACLRHFRLNEAMVVDSQDPGALHQSRVAMRRFRSALTLFRPVIADAEYQRLREEVRWFTNQLGDARNLDVLLKRFGPDKGGEAEALTPRLLSAREKAYAQVLDALGSERLRTLMIDLVAWIETGDWRADDDEAGLPLPSFASAQLDKRWRKVKKGGKALDEIDPEPRHQLRIEVKKLRYAVEFLSSLTAGDAALQKQKAFVSALEEIQEQLGELNDAETARELLGQLLPAKEDEGVLSYARQRLERSTTEEEQIEAARKAHSALTDVGRFWR